MRMGAMSIMRMALTLLVREIKYGYLHGWLKIIISMVKYTVMAVNIHTDLLRTRQAEAKLMKTGLHIIPWLI